MDTMEEAIEETEKIGKPGPVKKLLKFTPLIGIFLFIFIILNIDLNKLIEIFSNINVFYLIVVLMSSPLIVLLKMLKWRIIIKSCDVDYNLKEAIAVYYISTFMAMITPGRIGEFAKALYLKQSKDISLGKSFSTVMVDRILDIAMLIFLALISIFIFSYLYAVDNVYLLMILIFLTIFVVIAASIMNKKYTKSILRPLFNKFIPEKYKTKIKVNFDEFYSGIEIIKNKKITLGLAIILTIIIWMGTFFQFYILALALNINISYFSLLLICPIMLILEILPITFTGIGVREAALILFFSTIGLSAVEAVSFSLVVLLYQYISTFPGIFFWAKKPIKI